MHTHWIEIFDRADDPHIVGAVAHHFELEFLPSLDRLLDQHFVAGRLLEPIRDFGAIVVEVASHRTTRAAQSSRRSNDHRESNFGERLLGIGNVTCDRGARNLEADLQHRLLEQIAILSFLDCRQLRPDQFAIESFEYARFSKLDRKVQRRLSADRRQQRVRPLALNYLRQRSNGHRLDISAIRQLRVGHDSRGIRINQDEPQTFLAQRLERLRSGVVELASLSDHDRTRANQQNRL